MNPDKRPPDASRHRLPQPFRILDSLAAIALHEVDRALNGIRHRHSIHDLPGGEADLHQDEHCLCGPVIERLPVPVDGSWWILTHFPILEEADLEHED